MWRTALDTWIVETQDRGEFPETEEIVAPFEKEMHDWFGTPDWYKNKIQRSLIFLYQLTILIYAKCIGINKFPGMNVGIITPLDGWYSP